MKKILSIVIGVFLGTTIAFSQGTVTINGYAQVDGINGEGGTITVTGFNANVSSSYKKSWTESFTATGATVLDKTAKEARRSYLIGSTKAGVKLTLNATPDKGYAFSKFVVKKTVSNEVTVIYEGADIPWNNSNSEISYVGSNYTINSYAVFKPLVKLPEPNQVRITMNVSGASLQV